MEKQKKTIKEIVKEKGKLGKDIQEWEKIEAKERVKFFKKKSKQAVRMVSFWLIDGKVLPTVIGKLYYNEQDFLELMKIIRDWANFQIAHQKETFEFIENWGQK